MKFNKTTLEGAYTIELDRIGDDRGFFARFFCSKEFSKAGLIDSFVQINNSLTKDKGTLRGMHYQLPPSAEVKVVRCIQGALFDIILDLRPDSPTFGKWHGDTLSAENRRMMYVPRGFAHGFITLEENTEAFYLAGAEYAAEQERGIRYNDPKFNIEWPIEPNIISKKDENWPDFDPEWHGVEKMRGV
jgi:dTDP-4-dehydrorhamnose 3,5-epimerase